MLAMIANTLIKTKWLALFACLVIMALPADAIDYIRTTNGVNPTFFETILLQTNDPQMVLFPLMYILLLFTRDENMGIKKERTPFQLLQGAFLSTAIFIGFFVIANLLYCIIFLNISNVFCNTWSFVSEYIYIHMSPLVATSVSIILLFVRFSFILFLISFINTLTRTNHWGFWIAFLISYIDFILYDFLKIRTPLGILPIEHTRIIYTEAYIPDNTATRIPYYTSLLYWIGLFAVVFLAFVLIYKKRRRNEEKAFGFNDCNHVFCFCWMYANSGKRNSR